MIRNIAVAAVLVVLAACQTTAQLPDRDYTATVVEAAETVCIPNVGDNQALRSAAARYTGDSGKEFPSKDVTGPITVWHYQIVQDRRNVAFIAIGTGGCGVFFVNNAANLGDAVSGLGVEMFGNIDVNTLVNRSAYGRIGNDKYVVNISAFDFEPGKASKGVGFMTLEKYNLVEVPRGAPKLEWGG